MPVSSTDMTRNAFLRQAENLYWISTEVATMAVGTISQLHQVFPSWIIWASAVYCDRRRDTLPRYDSSRGSGRMNKSTAHASRLEFPAAWALKRGQLGIERHPFSSPTHTPGPMDKLSPLILRKAAELHRTRLLSGSILLILLWDTCLVFAEEVEYVWKKGPRFNLVTICYILNRYISLVALGLGAYHLSDIRDPINISFCHQYLTWGVILQVLSGIVSKYIMTLRVVALYNRSRWIIISLWLTFFLCYGFALGLDIYATTFNKAHAYIAPIGGVCDVLNAPHYFALIFCVPLVYELYLTVLTLKQGVIHARALRQLSVAPFLRILFVEKIVYFIAITAIRIALIWLLVSGQNLFTGLGFLWSLEVVIVSRFHLEMNVIFHVGSATTSLWTSSEKGNYTKPDVTFARGEMTETQDIQMATIEEHRSQGQLATIEERPSQGREAV